jgi:HlyD family secretion protein
MSIEMDLAIHQPWWRSRQARLAGAGALAAAVSLAMAGAFLSKPQSSVRVPLSNVTIDAARTGVFHDLTTLQGKVVPKDTVYLDALEGGQVQRVLVQAGDRVAAGQPLVEFRNTELELEVLDQEGRLVESITQLQSYEKQLEQNRADNEKALAQIDYNVLRLKRMASRRDPLLKAGYLAPEASDQIHDELDYDRQLRPLQVQTNERQEELRREQLPQIHNEMQSLQKSLSVSHAKLDDLVVKAPVAGRLTAMDLKIGENRNRGDRLGEITLDTGFKISADVDEFYLGRVSAGQSATIDVHGQSETLKVTRVYPQVHGGVFTIDLVFTGRPPDGLIPGETVQGRLTLGADRPGLIVPTGPFLERTGGDWIFVVAPDGRHADRRRIRIGRRTADQVEVLAGLKPGEQVITSDYQGWDKIERIDLKR